MAGLFGSMFLSACDPGGVEAEAAEANDAEENTSELVEMGPLEEPLSIIDPASRIKAIETEPDAYSADFLIVTNAERGTVSQELGMVPGSKVTQRGGAAMNRYSSPRLAGDLVWTDPKGVIHRDKVDEGKTGFWHEPGRSFEVWYVRHGNRNDKWDHMVVAATAIQEQDPELARQFWEKSLQLGYPKDQLYYLSNMIIATMLGDMKQAVACAKSYGPLEQTPDKLPMWESDWQQVAAISGDPHWLEMTAEYYEDKLGNDIRITRHRDMATMLSMSVEDAGNPTDPPSVLAESMTRETCLKDMDYGAPWCSTARGVSENIMEMFAAATTAHDEGRDTFDPVRLAQSRDFMHKGWNGPDEKARDIDMTLRFRVKPLQGSSPCRYFREFHIGLANHDRHGGKNSAQVPPTARILSLCFSYHTSDEAGISFLNASVASREDWSKLMIRYFATALGKPPVSSMPDKRPKPGDLHTLRLVRVGNWAEAILDGKRLALVAVPPHLDHTGTHWFISGTEVEVTGYTLDVLR